LNVDMCKFESLQKDESTAQSTDSSKAYRNTSAFKFSFVKLLFFPVNRYIDLEKFIDSLFKNIRSCTLSTIHDQPYFARKTDMSAKEIDMYYRLKSLF